MSSVNWPQFKPWQFTAICEAIWPTTHAVWHCYSQSLFWTVLPISYFPHRWFLHPLAISYFFTILWNTVTHPHSHSLQPAVISWWVLVVPFSLLLSEFSHLVVAHRCFYSAFPLWHGYCTWSYSGSLISFRILALRYRLWLLFGSSLTRFSQKVAFWQLSLSFGIPTCCSCTQSHSSSFCSLSRFSHTVAFWQLYLSVCYTSRRHAPV